MALDVIRRVFKDDRAEYCFEYWIGADVAKLLVKPHSEAVFRAPLIEIRNEDHLT